MLPQKIFENLPTVVAILVLFEQFLLFRQILFKFFARNSECFTKYDACCSDIFDCYRKGSKL